MKVELLYYLKCCLLVSKGDVLPIYAQFNFLTRLTPAGSITQFLTNSCIQGSSELDSRPNSWERGTDSCRLHLLGY